MRESGLARRRCGQPALPCALKTTQFVLPLQRGSDGIDAGEESFPGSRVDVESRRQPVGGEGLGGEIDGDHCIRVDGDRLQALHYRLGQLNRQQADVHRVVAENVGKRGGDHGLEPPVLDGPHRVLPGGATPEVVPDDQDLGPTTPWIVDDELGPGRPIVVMGPVVEEEAPLAGSLDPLQELLGDYLIGVDIGTGQGDHGALNLAHRFHDQVLTSTKCPATAAAAAMAGLTRWVRAPRP